MTQEPIKGQLEAFFETGTEGVLWSLWEGGKSGYDGLHVLKDGDLLTVFNDAARDSVLWQGSVKLEFERLRQSSPYNPECVGQTVFGFWVHGFQEGMEPHFWAKMFFDEKPAELVRAAKQPKP